MSPWKEEMPEENGHYFCIVRADDSVGIACKTADGVSLVGILKKEEEEKPEDIIRYWGRQIDLPKGYTVTLRPRA